ncbi:MULTISPECIES: histidine phosphatase family protein [unclassified Mycobacterium]|uniref:histidine phosphatase family protein n=1 Tax=unclassified Mycobacterium TaxID=2642494 RepID=UPI0029C889CA|nr:MULTISPECIES: histidine phosphatase family protein [unclassified Mycobacterium]
MRTVLNAAASAVIAVVLFVVMALPAWAAGTPMTLTFVRHGQSTANEAGILNTAVPGPGLTALGQLQAQDVAAVLATQGHDGIYASTMVRTQQTAAPLGSAVVLPGLQEIDAGVFEGTAERGPLALLGYALPPLAWTFGLRAVPILGSADSGNAFDARVDGAVKTIYDTGDRNPVVYSHGATIMFWVMMNVDNPDPLLILTHPLDNTDVVVVNGTPDDGWTLTDWDGVRVDPNPSLVGRLVVAVRDVLVGLQGGSRPAPTSVPTTGVTTVAHDEVQPAAVQAKVAAKDPESPPAATTEPSVSTLTSRKSKKAAEAPAEDSPVATNGATDLSDGNMAHPGTDEPKSAEPEGDKTQPSTSPVAPTSVEAGTDDEDAKPAAA